MSSTGKAEKKEPKKVPVIGGVSLVCPECNGQIPGVFHKLDEDGNQHYTVECKGCMLDFSPVIVYVE